MKSDASERKSGRRELAQYVRIAPMDFERSLGLAFGHEDHVNIFLLPNFSICDIISY